MRLLVLWSDFFFWLLFVIGTSLFVYHYRYRPLFRSSIARLLSNRIAVVCLCILSTFFLIALLDSIHVQKALPQQSGTDSHVVYETEPVSILDLLLGNLRTQKETTYSAPFALYGASKETVDTDGAIERVYPRLIYGGTHLTAETERLGDIGVTLIKSTAIAAIVWCFFLGLTLVPAFLRRRLSFFALIKVRFSGQTTFAWRSFYLTVGFILWLIFTLGLLSQHYHVFGTDKVGQDVLYLSLKAIRCSLLIGTLPTLVLLPIAIWLGLIAGYFKGWVDDIVQYLYTTLNSIPGVLLIAAAILVLQVTIDTHTEWFQTGTERADLRLLALCIVLGATGWTALCRLLRAETLKLRELEFVQAAQAFGVSNFTILRRHLLPNVFHLILITLVMDFSAFVLAEAVLSYVGIGVDPTMISFGTMINMARMEMAREPIVWWSLLAAFVFLFALVLSANLLADAVQEAFDARSRMVDRRVCWNKLKAAKAQWLT